MILEYRKLPKMILKQPRKGVRWISVNMKIVKEIVLYVALFLLAFVGGVMLRFLFQSID